MRVFLDVQATQTPVIEQRGLSRWVDGFAVALAEHHPEIVAGFGLNPSRPPPPPRAGSQVQRLETVDSTATSLRRALADGPFAYHVASPFEDVHPIEALLPPFVAAAGLPLVATVFDLIPLEMPGTYLKDPRVERAYRRRLGLLDQADLLLAISEDVRSHVIERLGIAPDRVATIGAAAAPAFVPAGPGDDPARRLRRDLPAIVRPFVLAATGDDPRKNLEGLLAAWARLGDDVHDDFQLVVTGRFGDASIEELRSRITSTGGSGDEVVVAAGIDDDLLVACYQQASLFVFPSLAEGFGLAALEAAACDCPTLTSDVSAVPEVLQDAAATFDPHDPDAIATAIDTALRDERHRERLVQIARTAADVHTWAAVAERAATAYRSLEAGTSVVRHRPPRARVAVIGPLEPAASEPVVFTTHLVRELEQRCDLDHVVTQGPIEGHPREHRRFRPSAIGRLIHLPTYDVVYDVGARDDSLSAEEQVQEILESAEAS